LYGSFAGKTEEAIIAVGAPPGGVGKKRKYKGYPRRILIDGQLITVKSAREERELLAAWKARLEAAMEQATEAKEAQIRIVAKRVDNRIQAVEDRATAWRARLDAEDEELLTLESLRWRKRRRKALLH
jgi:hypothetical protein